MRKVQITRDSGPYVRPYPSVAKDDVSEEDVAADSTVRSSASTPRIPARANRHPPALTHVAWETSLRTAHLPARRPSPAQSRGTRRRGDGRSGRALGLLGPGRRGRCSPARSPVTRCRTTIHAALAAASPASDGAVGQDSAAGWGGAQGRGRFAGAVGRARVAVTATDGPAPPPALRPTRRRARVLAGRRLAGGRPGASLHAPSPPAPSPPRAICPGEGSCAWRAAERRARIRRKPFLGPPPPRPPWKGGGGGGACGPGRRAGRRRRPARRPASSLTVPARSRSWRRRCHVFSVRVAACLRLWYALRISYHCIAVVLWGWLWWSARGWCPLSNRSWSVGAACVAWSLSSLGSALAARPSACRAASRPCRRPARPASCAARSRACSGSPGRRAASLACVPPAPRARTRPRGRSGCSRLARPAPGPGGPLLGVRRVRFGFGLVGRRLAVAAGRRRRRRPPARRRALVSAGRVRGRRLASWSPRRRWLGVRGLVRCVAGQLAHGRGALVRRPRCPRGPGGGCRATGRVSRRGRRRGGALVAVLRRVAGRARARRAPRRAAGRRRLRRLRRSASWSARPGRQLVGGAARWRRLLALGAGSRPGRAHLGTFYSSRNRACQNVRSMV